MARHGVDLLRRRTYMMPSNRGPKKTISWEFMSLLIRLCWQTRCWSRTSGSSVLPSPVFPFSHHFHGLPPFPRQSHKDGCGDGLNACLCPPTSRSLHLLNGRATHLPQGAALRWHLFLLLVRVDHTGTPTTPLSLFLFSFLILVLVLVLILIFLSFSLTSVLAIFPFHFSFFPSLLSPLRIALGGAR